MSKPKRSPASKRAMQSGERATSCVAGRSSKTILIRDFESAAKTRTGWGKHSCATDASDRTRHPGFASGNGSTSRSPAHLGLGSINSMRERTRRSAHGSSTVLSTLISYGFVGQPESMIRCGRVREWAKSPDGVTGPEAARIKIIAEDTAEPNVRNGSIADMPRPTRLGSTSGHPVNVRSWRRVTLPYPVCSCLAREMR